MVSTTRTKDGEATTYSESLARMNDFAPKNGGGYDPIFFKYILQRMDFYRSGTPGLQEATLQVSCQ